MHQVSRKGRKHGGTYDIYDGREDAIAHGISPENILNWKDYSVKIGNWVEYPDHAVTEVIRVYGAKERQDKRNSTWIPNKYKALHVTTRLNCYSQSQTSVTSNCVPYSSSTQYAKPETITVKRTDFAVDWLLGGLSIEDSCRKNLWQSRFGKRGYRTYAFLTISLPWFDELLKTNRLIRDRYMTLVGALGAAGVDEAYIAEQLKKDMESENPKLHINAINNAIQLLEASAAKKRIPIQASWQVESPTSPKQLPEPANIDSILKDTLHEHIASTVSETPRVETVPSVNQDRNSGSPVSETKRDERVSTNTSDRERLSLVGQVVSTNQV